MADQEFIPKDEYNNYLRVFEHNTPSSLLTRIRTRREVSRNILTAFDIVGGLPTFAAWASENPTEFYKMYVRLAPRPESDVQEDPDNIHSAVPPGPLDDNDVNG